MSTKSHEPIIAKYLPQIQKMRLLDEAFMLAVFDNNIEGAEAALKTITEKSDLKVSHVIPKRETDYGSSASVEIHATDTAGRPYNIVIQRADENAWAMQARYIQAIVVNKYLSAGADPETLPETYLIFITERDLYGRGYPAYHVDPFIVETGKLLDDGTHIIYVNGAYEGNDSELGSLIADFRESDPSEVRNKALSHRMKYLKESEEGVKHLCEIMDDFAREDAAQHKEFLRLIKELRSKSFSLNFMAFVSNHYEDEVIAALNELGLPIPD